jgi:hypothetical protein
MPNLGLFKEGGNCIVKDWVRIFREIFEEKVFFGEDFFLVTGHLGKGLVEFVWDGLELFLFMDQFIWNSKKRNSH